MAWLSDPLLWSALSQIIIIDVLLGLASAATAALVLLSGLWLGRCARRESGERQSRA